ncbi:MAG TPA: hypothetical protein VJ872_08240 [Nocardioides sp.]|nr:hypothetical protein [Nocardioides sp.]
MKLRTSLGAGIAAAAVASTVIGTAAPSLAVPVDGPWNVQVSDYGTGTAGMAVSGDGSTAYVVVNGGGVDPTVVPVNLSSSEAGTPVSFPASQTNGNPAANGSTVAVAGSDTTGNAGVWTISNGTATAVTLPGDTSNGFFVQGVTSTADGFLAVGAINSCFVSWTWATDATTATESAPVCNPAGAYMPFAVTTDATTGTAYAVVADQQESSTEQLWNLSAEVAPVTLPAGLGNPAGLTVGADGTVYVAGSGANGDNAQIASVHPGNPEADTLQSTGAYLTGSAQLGLVNGKLWLSSWGITVLDPADTTAYTPEAPAPALNVGYDGPQGFAATADADYLLLPSDQKFQNADSSTAPGLVKVVAPAAPAPTRTLSGTTATVAWNAASNGGTTITSATVTPTDTTTGTVLAPVRTGFFGDAGYLDGDAATVDVTGLTRGHTYTFAVTQGNGFFTSEAGTSAPLAVPLPATPKPSAVAVAGTPQVGTRLTIRTTGSWPTGTALTYAWYAGTTKVGTASSYTPKAADVGKKIKVAVTGTSAGHSPSTVTSALAGPVTQPVYKVPSKPTITGTARVGRILTAHISGLPANATVKYQWAYNGGQYGGPIGRPTTSTTLKVPASVRGTRIEVIALVTVPGYRTGSAMSALTAVVH